MLVVRSARSCDETQRGCAPPGGYPFALLFVVWGNTNDRAQYAVIAGQHHRDAEHRVQAMVVRFGVKQFRDRLDENRARGKERARRSRHPRSGACHVVGLRDTLATQGRSRAKAPGSARTNDFHCGTDARVVLLRHPPGCSHSARRPNESRAGRCPLGSWNCWGRAVRWGMTSFRQDRLRSPRQHGRAGAPTRTTSSSPSF